MDKSVFSLRTRDILKIIGVLALLYTVYLIWDILLLLFVALIFAALIDPFAASLARRKIPRGIAVIIIYIAFFGIVGVAVGVLAPVIAHDVPQLVETSSEALGLLSQNEWLTTIFGTPQQSAAPVQDVSFSGFLGVGGSGALAGLFSTVSGFFAGFVSLLIVLVMTFYLVVQDDPLGKILRSVVPDEYIPYLSGLIKRMRDKLGAWMRGQLVLSLVIGTLVTIGLSIIGVKYAAVLGLLAALFEFIPILGPVLASLPALFLAFSGGGTVTFVIVLVMYIVIQQFENHILVPKVMQRAVGLNPIVSIIAILVGVRIGGIFGVLLAIPVATALSVILTDIFKHKKHNL
jgi:predicted PurR-regulated permease PerM